MKFKTCPLTMFLVGSLVLILGPHVIFHDYTKKTEICHRSRKICVAPKNYTYQCPDSQRVAHVNILSNQIQAFCQNKYVILKNCKNILFKNFQIQFLFYNDKNLHNCENCWFLSYSLRKKSSFSELLWSVFSLIPTEYGEIRSISTFSVRMRENADQDNSEYGHFSRSDSLGIWDYMSPRFAKSQKIKSDITNQHLDIFVKIF